MLVLVSLIGFLLLESTHGQQVVQPCYSCGNQQQVIGCNTQCSQTHIPLQKEVVMTCEDGYVLQNGFCIRKMEISCPPGSRLENGRCVVTHSVLPTCPLGSELRGGMCVKIFEYVCPSGYNLVNGNCQRSETIPINCPPGSIFQNNECIRFECPRNSRLENGICVAVNEEIKTECRTVCPSGYYIYNNLCYSYNTSETITPNRNCSNPIPPFKPGGCGGGGGFTPGGCIRNTTECPQGTVQQGNMCKFIECPSPLVWNGQSCVYIDSERISGGSNSSNIVNNTHTVHNINNVTHDTHVNVNNLNNVYIYKGGEVIRVSNGTITREIISTEAPSIEDGEPEPGKEHCCTVVTPRVCKQVNGRWRCFNRKYERCGSFCTQPVIQLKPQRPINRPPILVMPPTPQIPPNCGPTGCNGPINCSGCHVGGYCSSSCYAYFCGTDCIYHDHQTFCDMYPGPGCSPEDGCYY